MKYSQIKKECITCGKEFSVIKSRYKTAKYCNKKCIRMSVKLRAIFLKQSKSPKTKEWREMRSKKMMSENNPMWKGDKAGLDAIHIWVLRNKPKPKVCEICKKAKPKDLANISQKYHREVNDFEWLCRRCHMIKDGRLEKLKMLNKL